MVINPEQLGQRQVQNHGCEDEIKQRQRNKHENAKKDRLNVDSACIKCWNAEGNVLEMLKESSELTLPK
jgi:hypothetical protein